MQDPIAEKLVLRVSKRKGKIKYTSELLNRPKLSNKTISLGNEFQCLTALIKKRVVTTNSFSIRLK